MARGQDVCIDKVNKASQIVNHMLNLTLCNLGKKPRTEHFEILCPPPPPTPNKKIGFGISFGGNLHGMSKLIF